MGVFWGFVKSGIKPSRKFLELLYELCPGLEHKILYFELRYKPLVKALCWVALSKSPASKGLDVFPYKRDESHFPKDLLLLSNHAKCLLKLKSNIQHT